MARRQQCTRIGRLSRTTLQPHPPQRQQYRCRKSHNIYLLDSDNLIEGNEIDHGGFFGITIYASKEPSRNVIRRNRVHDNCLYGGSEIGISGGTSNAVYDNLVYGSADCYGIGVEYSTPGSTLVYNNTVVLNGGIRIGSDASGTRVSNNIIRTSNNSGPGRIENAGSDSTESNNLTVDPLFVDAGVKDFRLTSGSPARDTGLTISSVPFDYDGVARPQGAAYDIGA